ncbi:putative isomerase YddE [Pseudovibrio sp. W64]|uniref:PhzF family phenazine biosynthesis protein n=1 Tax=unclassified Pseudovibrio TaxID=2627060 RepID=UPI0007AEE092|nr:MULTISPECIES: PhzF family phenazine biosynthesis protein [unclassified Pseudovibrio]KZK78114.1 putative isomerase YddE [Pseudovibrio sp. W64]KZK86903.1 putative isomerase YddE [Pseudovibrio sp. Ad13]
MQTDLLALQHISAFSHGEEGGNPAGVLVGDVMLPDAQMQSIAADLGYSETVFAVPLANEEGYRVRYFSPENEVPFCGHATIALGAVLAQQHGRKVHRLALNETMISVESWQENGQLQAALQSPQTKSAALENDVKVQLLDLLGLSEGDLDLCIPPARIHGGADHLVLALTDRAKLAGMAYDLEAMKQFMLEQGLVTIMLVHVRGLQEFDVRNAFASAGVFEDPATGAAAAAFSGYLRDIGWAHGGEIRIVQGEDMGAKSLISAEIPAEAGSSIRIAGSARRMI